MGTRLSLCSLLIYTVVFLSALQSGAQPDTKSKTKFSSYFNNVVIELDKDTYGPDNHLVEWHRSSSGSELDGFTVSGGGDGGVCGVCVCVVCVCVCVCVFLCSCIYVCSYVCVLKVQTLLFTGDSSRRRNCQMYHSTYTQLSGICIVHVH